jgi:hypothetical protein
MTNAATSPALSRVYTLHRKLNVDHLRLVNEQVLVIARRYVEEGRGASLN